MERTMIDPISQVGVGLGSGLSSALSIDGQVGMNLRLGSRCPVQIRFEQFKG